MPCRLFVFRYIFAWPILKLFVQFLRGSPNMQIGLTIFMFKGPMRFHFALYIYIYKKKKRKKKETTFFFSHYLVFDKSDISWIDIYCFCICASYALTFHLTELSNYFICDKNTFFAFLHVRSYALVDLFANRYVDTVH